LSFAIGHSGEWLLVAKRPFIAKSELVLMAKAMLIGKCVFPGASVSAETGGQETAKIDGRIDSG
jgi:hypothetical protein